MAKLRTGRISGLRRRLCIAGAQGFVDGYHEIFEPPPLWDKWHRAERRVYRREWQQGEAAAAKAFARQGGKDTPGTPPADRG